jgi:hypothetical protein
MNHLLKKDLKLRLSTNVPTVNFTGKWKNELGSSMEIIVNTNGQVRGIYKTAVGNPTNMEEFEINGVATGDLISFSANFGKYGSLTSWTGQYTKTKAGDTIQTMWHLAVNFEDQEEEKKLWSGIWTGSNTFVRA